MSIEIRDNWSLSVLPLPKDKVPAKATSTSLSSQDPKQTIVRVKRVGTETDAYAEPGSVIDIYV